MRATLTEKEQGSQGCYKFAAKVAFESNGLTCEGTNRPRWALVHSLSCSQRPLADNISPPTQPHIIMKSRLSCIQ